MRQKKKIARGIHILLKAKDLTPKEKKRLRIYLEKKKQLDAMPHQKCKNPYCKKMIPIPMEFCSSMCLFEYEEFLQKKEVLKRLKME